MAKVIFLSFFYVVIVLVTEESHGYPYISGPTSLLAAHVEDDGGGEDVSMAEEEEVYPHATEYRRRKRNLDSIGAGPLIAFSPKNSDVVANQTASMCLTLDSIGGFSLYAICSKSKLRMCKHVDNLGGTRHLEDCYNLGALQNKNFTRRGFEFFQFCNEVARAGATSRDVCNNSEQKLCSSNELTQLCKDLLYAQAAEGSYCTSRPAYYQMPSTPFDTQKAILLLQQIPNIDIPTSTYLATGRGDTSAVALVCETMLKHTVVNGKIRGCFKVNCLYDKTEELRASYMACLNYLPPTVYTIYSEVCPG